MRTASRLNSSLCVAAISGLLDGEDCSHKTGTKPRRVQFACRGSGRRNRTIREATVKRFHYDSHSRLETHLANFISAYYFGRQLKTLIGLTPYEFICIQRTIERERFILNPVRQMPGLNT